jgi:O-acetyl-ADP-ribose deacetylase (regulator of RNase III)
VRGDITDQEVDAIVNAANSSLMGGGGVDGAIHRRGGPAILKACKEIRQCQWPDGMPAGKAVITTGGRLRARYVIHTVGPVWKGGNENESEILASCYKNSLSVAKMHELGSIAFPSISTGAYGYPVEEASGVALRMVKDFVEKEGRLAEVVFVLFTEADLKVYIQTLRELG